MGTTKAALFAMAALWLACGPSAPSGGNPGGDGGCDPALPTACVGDEVHVCTDEGEIGDWVRTCNFESCSSVTGDCQDACAQARRDRSYIGCEYWPVDLDNAVDIWGDALLGCSEPASVFSMEVCVGPLGVVLGACEWGDCSRYPLTSCATREVCGLDAQHSPFAIVVANPDDGEIATVTLNNAAGDSHAITVGPGEVVPIFPQAAGFADQSTRAAGIAQSAYRLTSTHPIVAYQFNPLHNVGVFSNDASMLIPAHAFDSAYYAITYWSDAMFGYSTVVASEPGTTTITVRPTANLRAGRQMLALAAGATATFQLEQFDTLTLQADTGADMTGTEIRGDKRFGAYAGHEATPIAPTATGCYADHLEEQLFPSSTWGKKFVLPATVPRRGAPDLVRVLAQRPGTTVTIQPTGSCGPLDAGEYCDVFVSNDIEVAASEPVLVARYLVSVGETIDGGCDSELDPRPPGDPALALVPPVEQFRTSYTFLIPMYYREHYVSLVVPLGGSAQLDGVDVTPMLSAMGSGSYQVGRIPVGEGAHELDCDSGCGIEVYGWHDTVSYLFAGGLDLQPIVID